MLSQKDSLLKSVLSFLVFPSVVEDKNQGIGFKVWNILILISWALMLNIALGILIFGILELLQYKGENSVVVLASGSSIWLVIFLACVVAPLTEEAAFRLGLVFKPIFVALGVFFLANFGVRAFWYDANWIVALTVPLVFAIVVYALLKIKVVGNLVHSLYQNHFRFVLYLSILLFGAAHLLNYSGLDNLWIVAPILFLPQLIAGIVLSFVRIKYGFWYGVLNHMIYNSSLIPSLLALNRNIDSTMTNVGTVDMIILTVISFGFISTAGFAVVTFLFDVVKWGKEVKNKK